ALCRYCAFLSHVLDVGQSGERFARDLLDAEIAARDLAAQAGYAYASIWKCNLRCYVETERRGRGDRAGGWDGLRCLRLVLLWLLDGAAELGGGLRFGAQAIGRASARRIARLYGRGVEAERRPSVGDRAGARLTVGQRPDPLTARGKVLAPAAGRIREGVVAPITQNRPTAVFFNGVLERHTALFFNGRDDVWNVGGNQIAVFFNGLLNRQTVKLFNS